MDKTTMKQVWIGSIGVTALIGVVFSLYQYGGGSLRSESLQDVVVPGACYLPTEIETLNTTKIGLENQLADLNNQLAQANEDTTKNSENIANTSTKIETLNKELLTDVVLEQKKEILDKAQQELEDRKNIDDLKAKLWTKQQYYNEQSASLKTSKTLLTSSTIRLNKLVVQVKAKKSLENNEKFLAEFLTSINKLSLQIIDLKALESKGTALNAMRKTLNPTTGKTLEAIQAYEAVLSAYNAEIAKYKSKYSTYTSPVIRPSKDLTPIYNEQLARYNTQYSSYTRTKTSYAKTYNQNNTVSAADLKQLEITASQENKELKASHTQLTNTVTALKAELDTLQNSINTAIKNYQTQYGYKTTIPDVTAIQSQYDKIEVEYGALKKKNDDIRAEIEKLNNDLAIYNNTLNDITGRISALQISINEKNVSIAEYANTIAQNNICPNTETYCRDSIDNDRDSALDCNDSDCVTSSECQTGTTENVSTVEIETHRESICNNHADDDFDGAMDCSDSDCANNSYCQLVDVGTAISIPGEVCDNGVDDNTDGVIDCADAGCASDPACHDAPPSSETSCDDGEDNDNNGAVDCADNACSTKDICTNGDEDPVCGNGKVETGEECDNGIDNHLDPENGCDTKCVLHTRSCTDVDPQDGIDDTDPNMSCVNKKERKRGDKTCMVCLYGNDPDRFSGENRFEVACNKAKIDGQTNIVRHTWESFSVSKDCPLIEHSTYKLYSSDHSVCNNHAYLSQWIAAVGNAIVNNYTGWDVSIPLEERFTSIIGIDGGCYSAGGEYEKGGVADTDFLTAGEYLFNRGFIWNIRWSVNQTYGHTLEQLPSGEFRYFPIEALDEGTVTFNLSMDEARFNPPVASFKECPEINSICSDPKNQNPKYIEGYNVSGIICGNSERYYCEVSSTPGTKKWKWKKDSSY